MPAPNIRTTRNEVMVVDIFHPPCARNPRIPVDIMYAMPMVIRGTRGATGERYMISSSTMTSMIVAIVVFLAL